MNSKVFSSFGRYLVDRRRIRWIDFAPLLLLAPGLLIANLGQVSLHCKIVLPTHSEISPVLCS